MVIRLTTKKRTQVNLECDREDGIEENSFFVGVRTSNGNLFNQTTSIAATVFYFNFNFLHGISIPHHKRTASHQWCD